MVRLKKCPFCGSRVKQIAQLGRYGVFGFLECESCKSRTRAIFIRDKQLDDADIFDDPQYDLLAKIWNSRETEDWLARELIRKKVLCTEDTDESRI